MEKIIFPLYSIYIAIDLLDAGNLVKDGMSEVLTKVVPNNVFTHTNVLTQSHRFAVLSKQKVYFP